MRAQRFSVRFCLMVAMVTIAACGPPPATPSITVEPSATRQPPAPTQTAVPPTLTSAATTVPSVTPTQTAVPPTLTPAATTIPSVTPTQTAVPATPTATPIPASAQDCRRTILEPTEIIHAVHTAGNWGTNSEARNAPSSEYFEYLHDLNVNWVGISVGLHYEDSMDSTVERRYSDVQIPTFTDEFLRQRIQAYHQHGFCVYLTLAFEAHEAEQAERPVYRWRLGGPTVAQWDPNILPEFWPWAIDHPDHQRFVAEFWETYTGQAVHFAQLAEEEGVALYSLGTETESLFRTRPSDQFPNDFGEELRVMVAAVREVYSGPLTYDMHYSAFTASEVFGPGSDHLWEDLGLDVIGLSAYFPLVDCPPLTVLPVEVLEERWERIFQEYLIPLQARNPDRPIFFTEFSRADSIGSPYNQASGLDELRVFVDGDGSGLDDGEETQANIYQALFTVMDRHPGVVNGLFPWDMWMISDEQWASEIFPRRHFSFRGLLAEDVIRRYYGAAPRSTVPTPVPPPADIPPQVQGCAIYGDQLPVTFSEWAWDGDVDVSSSEMVYAGEQAIEVTLQPWGGLGLSLWPQIDLSPFNWLIFYLNGGETAGQQLNLTLSFQDTPVGSVDLSRYIEDFPLQPGQWHRVAIPLSDLNAEGATIKDFTITDASGGGAATFYIDEIRLVASGP